MAIGVSQSADIAVVVTVEEEESFGDGAPALGRTSPIQRVCTMYIHGKVVRVVTQCVLIPRRNARPRQQTARVGAEQ